MAEVQPVESTPPAIQTHYLSYVYRPCPSSFLQSASKAGLCKINCLMPLLVVTLKHFKQQFHLTLCRKINSKATSNRKLVLMLKPEHHTNINVGKIPERCHDWLLSLCYGVALMFELHELFIHTGTLHYNCSEETFS